MSADRRNKGKKEKSADTRKPEEQQPSEKPVAQQPAPISPTEPPAVAAQIPSQKRRHDEPQQPMPPNVQAPTPEGPKQAVARTTEKLVAGAAIPSADVDLDPTKKRPRLLLPLEPPKEREVLLLTSKAVDNPQLITEAEIFAQPKNALRMLRVTLLSSINVLKPRCLEIDRFTQEELDAAVVPVFGLTKVAKPPKVDYDILRFKDEIGLGYLRVIGKIGFGGFGQVYAAWDCYKKQPVAIKAETIKQEVLKEREDNKHCPEFHNIFKTPPLPGGHEFFYVVMTLLSANLQQMRRKCQLNAPDYRLSMATAYGAAVQCLDAIKGLHEIGYIHRDIKPENFSAGVGDSKVVYLYDFGLCRRFRNESGAVIPISEWQCHGFKGTLRYASTFAHEQEELGRRDDLISLYYSLIELIRGRLPWAGLHNAKDVLFAKSLAHSPMSLCENMSAEFRQFARLIDRLQFASEPNYDEMCRLLRVCMAAVSNGIVNEYDIDYEWLHDDCRTFEHFAAMPQGMPEQEPVFYF